MTDNELDEFVDFGEFKLRRKELERIYKIMRAFKERLDAVQSLAEDSTGTVSYRAFLQKYSGDPETKKLLESLRGDAVAAHDAADDFLKGLMHNLSLPAAPERLDKKKAAVPDLD